jgi:hypothetical protein
MNKPYLWYARDIKKWCCGINGTSEHYSFSAKAEALEKFNALYLARSKSL